MKEPGLSGFPQRVSSLPVSWSDAGLMTPLRAGKHILATMCLHFLKVLYFQSQESGGESEWKTGLDVLGARAVLAT